MTNRPMRRGWVSVSAALISLVTTFDVNKDLTNSFSITVIIIIIIITITVVTLDDY